MASPPDQSSDSQGQLARGSVALATSVLANAVGGLVYWIVVARALSTGVVGASSALFQTLLFANFVGNVGLPVTVARYAAGNDEESSAVSNWSMLIRVVSAVLGVAVVLGLARNAAPIERLDEWGALAGRLFFAVAAVGAALAVIVEARLVTLRLWGWVVGRSVAVAVARLPLVALALLGDSTSGLLIFMIAVAPLAVSGYVGALALRLTVDRTSSLLPGPVANAHEIGRFSAVNWISLLATQAPVFGIPVIVAFATESREYAAFFIAWSFGAMAFLVPHTISQVALSELGKNSTPAIDNEFIDKVMGGLRLALLATCAGAIVAWLSADLIASIYGPGYRQLGFHLPLLTGASIAWAYTSMGLTAARAVDRHRTVVLLSATFVIATVVPTLLLVGRYGSPAATWSWLGGSVFTAAVTAMFFWQQIRTAAFR